ncbi:hypothetical protein [Mangrovitalea sediminis]|nr:hypothetical protein [Mangrovitalea sediminis]
MKNDAVQQVAIPHSLEGPDESDDTLASIRRTYLCAANGESINRN